MRRFLAFLIVSCLYAGPVRAELHQVTSDLPPLSMQSPLGHGYVYDLVGEAHRRLGLPYVPEFIPWPRAQMLTQQHNDYLIFSLARTAARESKYTWIAEMIEVPACVITLGGTRKITTIAAAMQLLHLGVARGTPWSDFLHQSGFKNLDEATDEETNARKLVAGNRIDGWYTIDLRAVYLLRKIGYKGDIVRGVPLQTDRSWLAASPNFDPALAAKLRDMIAGLRKDGTAQKIYNRYFNDLTDAKSP